MKHCETSIVSLLVSIIMHISLPQYFIQYYTLQITIPKLYYLMFDIVR